MILDSLKNVSHYAGLGKNIADAFAWIQTTNLASLEAGKVVIDGERLYASIQDYTTKPLAEGRWESHRRYIDIQVVVSGRETIGARAVEGLTVDEAYSDERDIVFYKGTLAEGTSLRLEAGDFALFFPHDAHAPMLENAGLATVKKVVVKVRAR